jgi:hypothetical protein
MQDSEVNYESVLRSTKVKIDELETNNKIKNIRDLSRGKNDFKKGYRPRTNRVQDEKGDLVADCHSILAR